MPVISLNIPIVQRNVTHTIESELTNLLGANVKIETSNIEWPNHITLKNVVVDDKSGDKILEAGNLTAGFKILPIFHGKLILTTVRIFGATFHITKDTPNSKTNIQFIIDKFSKNDNGNNNNIELQIKSILIRRGNIKYDVLNKENSEKQFNANHININDISGKISLKILNKDSLNIQIRKLSLSEASGFKIDKLSTNLVGSKDTAYVKNFALKLPNSSIIIPSAGIHLVNADSLSELFNKSPIYINIKTSKIAPTDLSAFITSLKKFSDTVELSANVSGFLNSVSLKQMNFKYGKEMSFTGNMDIKGLTDKIHELYLFGQVKHLFVTTDGLQKIINNLSKNKITLPEPIIKLGGLNFNGEISGFTDKLVAYGNLSSSIGALQMDMLIENDKDKDTTMYMKGNISSSDLNINKIFGENNPYGKARFNAKVDITKPAKQKMSGTINAQINEFEYKGYNYENIYLSGKFKANDYEGLIQINDPNGQLETQGSFKLNDNKPTFNFMASLKDFHPDKLNLTNKYKEPNISLDVNANFTGKNIDDFEGNINMKNLSFQTATDSFYIKNFKIETMPYEQPDKRIVISSDIINGEIKGNYSFSSLVADLKETAANYLPALIKSIKEDNKKEFENNLYVNMTVENTENISKTLNLPITIIKQSTIKGFYDSQKNNIDIETDMPLFNIKKTSFENGNLQISNSSEKINMQLNATLINKNIHNYINVLSDAKADRINTTINWSNDKKEKFKTEFKTSTIFVAENEGIKNKLRTEITIPASQMILKDSVWNIEPSSVTIRDGNIYIDNFFITKDNQHIRIDGTISNNPKETLLVDLNDIEMRYIFDVINIDALRFGGRATGAINAQDLFGSMMINGRLEIKDFSFNDAKQGQLNISSEWDNEEQGILLLGSIYKNDTTWSDVNGYIYPVGKKQGLSLYFDANDINIAFMQKYLNAFASDVKGRGFGKVHLYGPFSHLFIEGTPYIKDGNLKINILNTAYSFSDSIYIDKYSVKTKNLKLSDKNNNYGFLDMTLSHKNFKDLKYELELKADKIMAYDFSERLNPLIYGTVFASGTAQIKGNEEQINVDGNLKSEPGTSVGFNFMENSTAENYDFITFTNKNIKHNTVKDKDKNKDNDKKNSSINYQLNFLLNVTPDANIEFIMDPISGDKIKGNGKGNLQVQYGNNSDMQMFGNYIINNGSYNFSLQQVIHKLFKLQDGSTVLFRGDPMKADLNIDATYYLTANVQDLDETLIMETANYSSVPVNCVLSLNGQLQNPGISFDLNFPNSSSDFERKVKSFIDTEDMMTRQIIYLLVLNKFYTPDYSRNEYRSNEFSTVASSAISSQLSSILSSLTDKVQIGTNIRSRQDGVKDTEVEMLLSSQLLNNRLIFNGNFGYKDNYIQSNAFIGEFDLEYKLTRTGDIRLKAYNHANDLYRYNTKSLTRQGVGIMFQKNFSSLYDIFKKTKKEKKNNIEKLSEAQTGHEQTK